jgi:DNA-binding HxlR family transcriptional regulator
MTSSPRTARSRSRIGKLALTESAAGTFEFLGRPWVPQLLFLLSQRRARFSELKEALPAVSGRVLTERLRELCAEGLVERAVDEGPPIRITYLLTEHGGGLTPALQMIGSWADDAV